MSSIWIYKNVPGVHTLHRKLNQLSSYVPPPPSLRDDGSPKERRILLVHSHPVPTSFSAALANAFVEAALESNQAEVRRINLYDNKSKKGRSSHFNPVMSQQEREQYFKNAGAVIEPDNSHLSPETQQHIRNLQWCDTLVLVYPTWWSGAPASLKGWFERTLVPGSTWDFPSDTEPAAQRIGLVPRLNNIERIIGISTYGGSPTITLLAGDGGRNMISNNIRHAISPNASVLWLGLYNMDFTTDQERTQFLNKVKQTGREL